jgi:hypothetical protein
MAHIFKIHSPSRGLIFTNRSIALCGRLAPMFVTPDDNAVPTCRDCVEIGSIQDGKRSDRNALLGSIAVYGSFFLLFLALIAR